MAIAPRRSPRCPLLALGLFALVVTLSACGGDGGDSPGGGDAVNDDDAVRINQGTNPTVEGLSIGLATVSGDEAGMQIVGHAGDEMTIVEGRPGDSVELGDYLLEVLEVGDNDEGGYVTVVVTPPDEG